MLWSKLCLFGGKRKETKRCYNHVSYNRRVQQMTTVSMYKTYDYSVQRNQTELRRVKAVVLLDYINVYVFTEKLLLFAVPVDHFVNFNQEFWKST